MLDDPAVPPPASSYHLTHVLLSRAVEVKARESVGGGAVQVVFASDVEGDPPQRVDLIRFSRAHLLRFGDATQLIEKARREASGCKAIPSAGRPGRASAAGAVRRCDACFPDSETCPPACRKAASWRLLGYLRPYWKLSVLSLVASIGLTALALTPRI